MEYRRLGRSDLQVSAVILGCWIHGKSGWHDVDDQESISAIRAAVDAGMTTLDTAEWYGGGHSERVIAQAIEPMKREDLIIATKVAPTHLRPDQVFEACDRSLANLSTDYIDLYQIHWPNEEIPIADTMGALNELKEQGKIRAIGASNFDDRQMADALKHGRIESLQPPYSLFWRHIEDRILPFCSEQHIGVIAYSPLAQGLLTGKFTRDFDLPEDDIRHKNELFKGETYEVALDALDGMKPIAEKHGKTLGQVAINWVLCQPGLTAAIVGARDPEQARENAGGAGWRLDDESLARLDELGRRVMATLDESPVMWR